MKGSLYVSVPVFRHCACAVSGNLQVGGLWKPHTWNPQPHFAYSPFTFYGATMTIKGSLYVSVPIVSGFQLKIFKVLPKLVPKMAAFSENGWSSHWAVYYY